MWRLDRLGKQLEAVCAVLQVEVAELLGNEDRVNEILKERRQEHAEQKKANRQFLASPSKRIGLPSPRAYTPASSP
jgi:hypothetical protein